MKLEQQVVSLELAKKMKELGFEQESLFYWFSTNNGWMLTYEKDKSNWMDDVHSAYTVAELGEMLKIGGYDEGVSVAFTDVYFRSFKSGKSTLEHREYICSFNNWGKKTKLENGYDIPDEVSFTEPTEADARAKMLIYLKENNLLK